MFLLFEFSHSNQHGWTLLRSQSSLGYILKFLVNSAQLNLSIPKNVVSWFHSIFLNWIAQLWSRSFSILESKDFSVLYYALSFYSIILFTLNFSFDLELYGQILLIPIWLSTCWFILFFSLILRVKIADDRKEKSHITVTLIKYKMVISFTISIQNSINFLKRSSFKKCMRFAN